jgi:hypothetical protein
VASAPAIHPRAGTPRGVSLKWRGGEGVNAHASHQARDPRQPERREHLS